MHSEALSSSLQSLLQTHNLLLEGHTFDITCMLVTPDNSHLISGSRDKTLRIWCLHSLAPVAVLLGHTSGISSLCISNDQHYILSGSQDSTIKLWTFNDRNEETTLHGHTQDVTAVAITSDNLWIVSGSSDRSIRVWERTQSRQIAVLIHHEFAIISLAVTSDGQYIVSGSADKTFVIWNFTDYKPRFVMEGNNKNNITKIFITPGDTYAITAFTNGVVALLNLKTKRVKVLEFKNYRDTQTFELSKDCKYLVLSNLRFYPNFSLVMKPKQTCTIGVWDYTNDTTTPLREITLYLYMNKLSTFSTALTKDNASIIVCNGKELEIHHLETKQKRVFEGHTDSVTCVCFSNCGRYVISGSLDNTVRVWDLSLRKQIDVMCGHTSYISVLIVTSDDMHIVSGSNDWSVRVWSFEKKEQEFVVAGFDGEIRSIAFGRGGRYMVCSAYGRFVRVVRV